MKTTKSKQLVKKFGKLPEEYVDKITKLSNDKLEAIAIDIFDIESLEDLKKYF
jgi:hypothetical protein